MKESNLAFKIFRLQYILGQKSEQSDEDFLVKASGHKFRVVWKHSSISLERFWAIQARSDLSGYNERGTC